MRTNVWSALLILAAVAARVVNAAGGGALPVPVPPAGRPVPARNDATVVPEADYNEAVQHTAKGEWKQAEAAYRRAIAARDNFPEAWNGLGHALKKQRKFAEALEAYRKALFQRPQYAQALEYLGETYVAMGKAGEARETLAKLQPLDTALATQLERAIAGTKTPEGW